MPQPLCAECAMNLRLRDYQSWSWDFELTVPAGNRTTIAGIPSRRLDSVTTRTPRPHKFNFVECNDTEVFFFHSMKACRGIRGIAPLIHNLSNKRKWAINFKPRPLYPREYHGDHRTGGWMGPRGGRNFFRKRKNFLLLSEFEPWLFHP